MIGSAVEASLDPTAYEFQLPLSHQIMTVRPLGVSNFPLRTFLSPQRIFIMIRKLHRLNPLETGFTAGLRERRAENS